MAQCRYRTVDGRRCPFVADFDGYCFNHQDEGSEEDQDEDEDALEFLDGLTQYAGVPNFGPAYREVDVLMQLEQRLQARELECVRLRDVLDEGKEVIRSLQVTCSKSQSACDVLKREAQLLRQGNDTLRQRAEQLKVQLQTKVDELYASHKQASDAQSFLTAAHQKVLAAESAKLEAEQELQRERTKAQDAESSLHELQNQLDAAHKEQQPATAAAAKGIAAGGSRMIASLTRQVAEYAKQFKQGRLAVSHAEEKVALITQQLTASTNEFKASQLALQTANGQIMQLNTEIAKVKVALSAEQDTLLKIKDSLLQAEHDRDQLAADNDQLHSAVDELNKTIATSESASVVVSQPPGWRHPTVKYHDTDVLNFDDLIKDQFYDPGRQNAAQQASATDKIPSLMVLRAKMELRQNERETLLVDVAADQQLREFQAEVDEALLPLRTVQERAIVLAKMVSDRMGKAQTENKNILAETNKHIADFKAAVISIGAIQKGVCRHRSILFKVVADNLKPGSSVPSRLVRGRFQDQPHVWNVIRIDHINGKPEYAVVDVMHRPGDLLSDKGAGGASYIEYYKRVNRDTAGVCTPAGAGLESATQPRAENTHGWLAGLTLGDELGHGGFGTVHRAKSKAGQVFRTKAGMEVAIKTIKMQQAKVQDITNFKKEMQIASQLNHRNIVRCLDFSDEDANTLRIYMEYMAGGSLTGLINNNASYAVKVHIACQIAEGLLYLHTPKHEKDVIMHLDLKPDNVLLSKIEMGLPYVAKLVDFGISEAAGKPGTKSQLNTAAAGLSPAYASPEVIRMQTPTTKDDVYSFGILMWQLMTGKVPFADLGNTMAVCEAVTKGIRPSLKDIEGDAGVFTDLIQACWQKSPEGRPSMSEVVAWLQELCKGIPIPLN